MLVFLTHRRQHIEFLPKNTTRLAVRLISAQRYIEQYSLFNIIITVAIR